MKIINPVIQRLSQVFDAVLVQSGIFAILIKASVHRFWGMVRNVQVITFSTLVMVPLPAHAFNYFAQMFYLAKLDILNTHYFTSMWFDFKDTEAVNANFKIYSIVDSNFVHHSGSFFWIFGLITVASIVLCIAN